MKDGNVVIDKIIVKQCQFCQQFKEDVWHTVDPMAFELEDDHTEYDICDECWGNRSDDI